MTNRQSNIIFYGIIFFIISGFMINQFQPDAFDTFTKSNEQRLIEEAVSKREYDSAIDHYQKLVTDQINQDNENTKETAALYEGIASMYFLTGNAAQERRYYLKSLAIKTQLKNANRQSLANTYYKLGVIEEQEQQFKDAQRYYEQSLDTWIGDIQALSEEEKGLFTGMQQTREIHLRANHPDTIATYNKLASLQAMQNQSERAKTYYQKALAASIITYGEEDKVTLGIINAMQNLPNTPQ
jgi:tetratricopeptide (TPR) repeat protein